MSLTQPVPLSGAHGDDSEKILGERIKSKPLLPGHHANIFVDFSMKKIHDVNQTCDILQIIEFAIL